jgi:hypothetical protein
MISIFSSGDSEEPNVTTNLKDRLLGLFRRTETPESQVTALSFIPKAIPFSGHTLSTAPPEIIEKPKYRLDTPTLRDITLGRDWHARETPIEIKPLAEQVVVELEQEMIAEGRLRPIASHALFRREPQENLRLTGTESPKPTQQK